MCIEERYKDICEKYYNTTSAYELRDGWSNNAFMPVVIELEDENAYIYDNWEEMFKEDVYYCIEDDIDDLGVEDIKSYIGTDNFHWLMNNIQKFRAKCFEE